MTKQSHFKYHREAIDGNSSVSNIGIGIMSEKQVWEAPVLEDLGDAKDIIQDVSVVGSGDSQFSVLNPS